MSTFTVSPSIVRVIFAALKGIKDVSENEVLDTLELFTLESKKFAISSQHIQATIVTEYFCLGLDMAEYLENIDTFDENCDTLETYVQESFTLNDKGEYAPTWSEGSDIPNPIANPNGHVTANKPAVSPADKSVPSEKAAGVKCSEAPHKLHTHLPAPEAHRASVRLQSEKVKAMEKSTKENLFTILCSGERCLSVAELKSLPATMLKDYCKGVHSREGTRRGSRDGRYAGYSAMCKDDLVQYIHTGIRPEKKAPGADTVAGLREQVKVLKDAGLVSGPVSSAGKDTLNAAIAAANAGKTFTIVKSEPKQETADWYKNLLRNGQAKGYDAAYAAIAKKEFDMSISTMRKDDLVKLCVRLGLVAGKAAA